MRTNEAVATHPPRSRTVLTMPNRLACAAGSSRPKPPAMNTSAVEPLLFLDRTA